jgi:hypothetical protein
MIELRVIEQRKARPNSSSLGVVGSVYQASNPGLNHGAGAHGAWFDGDVNGRVKKSVVPNGLRCFSQDDNLGVRRGVAIANRAIPGASKDSTFRYKHGSHRDFTHARSFARFFQRNVHKL